MAVDLEQSAIPKAKAPPGPEREPLYRRIFVQLRKKIRDGEYIVGQYLPGERELCESYGISRITAVRVLNDLAASGLVVREQGRGTRVSYVARGRLMRGPTEFSQSPGENGQFAASVKDFLSTMRRAAPEDGAVTLFDFCDEKANSGVAEALDIPLGSPVRKMTRVWRFAGRPYNHLESYMPTAIANVWSRDAILHKPLALLIEDAGLNIGRIEENVSATLATDELAARLEVPVGSALLKVVRVQYERSGAPLQFVVGHYPSERYQYRVSLSRKGVRKTSRFPV